MRRVFSFLALLVAVSGCASTGEPQRMILQAADGLLPFVERQDARHEVLVRRGAPARRAALVGGGAVLDLRQLAVLPGGRTIWLAPDGSGFTFDGGLLVATRGAGEDIMSSDLSLLRDGRGGTAERFHTMLDGQGQIVLKSYVCTVTIDEQTAREDCAGLTDDFINVYQIALGTGRVLSSRQKAGIGVWQVGPVEARGTVMPSLKETL